MKAFARWLVNVLIAIDQLGNAIAGGDPDITISARVGYFANKCETTTLLYYWRFLEIVIDVAFYPLDGPRHCLRAIDNDNENGHVHGSDLARVVLGLMAVSACIPIAVFTWIAYLLGLRPPSDEL